MCTRRPGSGECDKVGPVPNETAKNGEPKGFTATGCDYPDIGLAVSFNCEIESTKDGLDVALDRVPPNGTSNAVGGVIRALPYYGGGAGTGHL